jgi:hypothetical protein
MGIVWMVPTLTRRKNKKRSLPHHESGHHKTRRLASSGAQRSHNENGHQSHEPHVTQQISLSKGDDIEREHEQRKL